MFAVVLIPINRVIAVKIGKLSADMMASKDARVKVCVCVLCVHVCMYVCMFVYMYVCMYVKMYECMHVRMCMYV